MQVPAVGEDVDEASRWCIDLSALPWVKHDNENSQVLPELLKKTQLALKNIRGDFKLTKSTLLNSSCLPQFPEPEWDSLLAGQSIDLDHILASASGYSAKHDKKWTEHIGDLELVSGSHKVSKTVEDHGDWTTTCNDLIHQRN